MTDKNSTRDSEAELRMLRAADLKLGLILLLSSFAFGVYTLVTFPMSGSYGGVENQWYVSPALFPLAVLGIIFFCATLLVANAISGGGLRVFLSAQGWKISFKKQKQQDRWYVIAVLAVYTYVYIPSMDFYLATVLFLLSLTLRFYLSVKAIFIVGTALHILLITSILVIRAVFLDTFYVLSTEATSIETLILYTDIVSAIVITVFLLYAYFYSTVGARQYIYMLITAMLVPIVLVIVFNFLLFVPMPVEYGSVMNILNYIAYDVIGLQ